MDLTFDQKVGILRGHVHMGHTPTVPEGTHTSFTMNLTDNMHHLPYWDVVAMLEDLANAALTRKLSMAEKYMMHFLRDNNIIAAFGVLGQAEDEGEL